MFKDSGQAEEIAWSFLKVEDWVGGRGEADGGRRCQIEVLWSKSMV